MNKIRNYLFIVFAIVILPACGGGGRNISKVELFPLSNGKKIQYIDREGKIIINSQFSKATAFREGLALVRTSDDSPKWGFIDSKGMYEVNPQYKAATIFSEGLAWVVSENKAPSAIDKSGKIKITLEFAEQIRIFKEGFAAYSILNDDGKEIWGFINDEGEVIISPQFSAVKDFSEGKCAVSDDESKWGYIDSEGKILINYQFDKAESFLDNYAVIQLNNKVGVIDENGHYVINPQFSEMINDGSIFLIEQNSKWGWCNKEGKIIINPQFNKALPYNGNNLAPVKSGDKWGYINKDGKIVINPQFDYAYPFNGDLALVSSGVKFGFIDNDGRYVVNPQFEAPSHDLEFYMTYGSSTNESVQTDYFNVEAITSAINMDEPEGFTFNSTFADVMKKYNLRKSKFRKNRSEHKIKSKKEISKDVVYNFYVLGKPYDKEYVRWNNYNHSYNTTELKFNKNINPTGYAYEISLSGKGANKEDIVMDTLKAILSNYKKGVKDGVDTFSDEKKVIYIRERSSKIVIIINFNRENTLNENEGNIDFREKIKGFLAAEDERNFNKLQNYFADNIIRYWNNYNINHTELKKKYEKSWKSTSNSKNLIKSINKKTDNTYIINWGVYLFATTIIL